eukprot:scaffold329083_cov61-Tisochrysis_lutea.AAC.1
MRCSNREEGIIKTCKDKPTLSKTPIVPPPTAHVPLLSLESSLCNQPAPQDAQGDRASCLPSSSVR